MLRDSQYYFRLHQVRPRFKNDIENVLLYVATEISKLETQSLDNFNYLLFNAIRLYTGNATKEAKTIDNWRTEIAALFGFIIEDNINNIGKAGEIAKKLAEEQDLVQFFKYFLFYFQYPGGHIKSYKLKEVIDNEIKFKPAQYFLRVLEAGEKLTGKRFSLNKAEATHFIYNDLRVTRDNCNPDEVVERILQNRENQIELDWQGDIIRYAGDILDYMVIADLLVQHASDYYINWGIRETITAFLDSQLWFSGYDHLFGTNFNVNVLKPIEDNWYRYVNKDLGDELFKTDVLKYLGIEEDAYSRLISGAISDLTKNFDPDNVKHTKEIGDFGENLIVGHESMRVKIGGREDLIHLIKKIPTSFAVGYDIQSVELDAKKRYIEVKATISNKSLNFYNFHLTPNEWSTAETLRESYFVYRLMISKVDRKLFVLKDPVGNYKKDTIRMSPRNGADIVFKEESGEWKELLIWKQ
ncbi:MAG: DUF3883 domain-containing protein [Bacteroidales bacterium]|nr:MAG: DUF3883 domain-containing protein [Bacteroidales bacterium]